MRLCRFLDQSHVGLGVYHDDSVIPLERIFTTAGLEYAKGDSLLPFLPGGRQHTRLRKAVAELPQDGAIPMDQVKLLVPVADPGKLILLAGNYAKHVQEGGGKAEERAKTFPYLFMKPPATTLTHPGDPIRIPSVSPDQIDWEIELGVILGKECSRVGESDALSYVAGYTVVNDVSDRNFRPNPTRAERPKDGFFDWQHGKWHDTFCPMGPCVLPADECDDPQALSLKLSVNGELEQNGTTADMIFPVAAIIEFVSHFVTLQPGDIISTGTPDGVGKAKGKFLKHGDIVEAEIGPIGVLRNPVV
ncbi:MAG: fumarylacetoacetate hydrolase family protein [Planctomycetaceae bacterium]|nr:fumarylacetoacetate hydrolase family protein [Planctomycetaceae bacterium]